VLALAVSFVEKGESIARDRAAFARMLRAEAHRGPDDLGFYSDDRVLLGHARLAVIDLSSSARQPMPTETGDVWISFSGAIYNFEEASHFWAQLPLAFGFRSPRSCLRELGHTRPLAATTGHVCFRALRRARNSWLFRAT